MGWSAELAVAREAAEAAGEILSRFSEGPRSVRRKGEVDLVTEIDLACEEAIRGVFARDTPDVPVLGEEGGGAAGGTRWIVDPLDGTTNFVHGFPWFCVSVALEVDGASVVAVVLDPLRERMYTATAGGGAFCGQRRLQVSACRDLGQALAGTGFPYDRRERASFYLGYLERILTRVQGVRRAGAAALDLAVLADGRLDVFWEFQLSIWDIAASVLLIEEAGGRVTQHDGAPLVRDRPSPLATNGWLHDAMVEALS